MRMKPTTVPPLTQRLTDQDRRRAAQGKQTANHKRHWGIICAECEQRPASGVDPATGERWWRCGCDPYPASVRGGKFGAVVIPADPTPEEIEAMAAEIRKANGEAVRRVDPEPRNDLGIRCIAHTGHRRSSHVDHTGAR